jgi:ABC-2 type transport system ATP-binding protein
MSQKVQVLGTLIHEPELVILDEPFSGLDPVNRDTMRDVILAMKKEGRTVIFSTHIMEQAEQICDAIFLIHKGRKIVDGKLADVKSSGDLGIRLDYDGDGAVLKDAPGVARINDSGKSAEIFLHEGRDPQDVLAYLVGKVKVRRFDLREPSLHEIFVRSVGENGNGGEKNA